MTTWTDLYAGAASLKRVWFRNTTLAAASVYNELVPVGAKCCIISSVGAGGWKTNTADPGGGAAFARRKLTNLTAGEAFSIQVGNPKFSLDAGTSQGDTIITRVTGSAVVCKAARGTGTIITDSGVTPPIIGGGIPGLAINSIGDVVRDGKHGNTYTGVLTGGDSGGDDDDIYSLGFGGRGAKHGRFAAAGPGGGGIARKLYDAYSYKGYPPGAGLACIEFFTKDPGF